MTHPNAKSIQDQAQSAYLAGDYRQAAGLFASAGQTFKDQGDLLSAAEMRNNQSVALLRAGDSQAAWQASDGTDATFAAAGDIRRQAMALGNQAAALDALGQWKPAIEHYEQAVDLLEKAGDRELRGVTLESLSALQLKHHRQIDAMISMQSSLAAKPRLNARENILRRLIRTAFNLLQRPPGT
jgi:tetratricopeptide (TPR) repeat protein